ncbi:MAG: DNA polymerase III subunit gamma/tau [Ardenticatenaceae bacterium]|nr:DNA polymerase III subunit gamma/tau [Anaerolineales bacterium]MCB8941344.1 DNA polymerase III subunit gamma/tau [Ardenticatenaceae bacterium]MCB8972700.1 DNA polymerase III subunit gamma/tau [Ardenticatenaceae bacterium]
MSQALYRKWRPGRFDDVIGQEHVTRTLKNSVTADRLGHAYLFCGPRGTGKTTSARLLAKAVNCLHKDPAERPCNQCSICQSIANGRFLDLIEIDAASNTGVDDIRELRDKINFSPSEGRFKVYIIDEVHMLSTAAFNALLKTLEEPPPHVKFVLATTEEHKVPVTIKSRCQQFNFRLLNQDEISERLKWLADKEGFTIEPEALQMIARQGAGSLRDAESLLDQLVVGKDDVITAERTQMVLGTASNEAVGLLTDAWLNRDGAGGLSLIHEALGSGTDPRQFCRQMVAYLRELLLLQAAGDELPLDATPEQRQEMLAQAQRAPRQGLIEAIKRFNEAALVAAGSWQPQLPLEMAFIELLPDKPMPAVAVTAVPTPASVEPKPAKAKSKKKEEPVAVKTAVPEPPPYQPEPQPEPVKPVAKETSKPAAQPLTVRQVQAIWADLVARSGDKIKNLPALLNMGKPLAAEGRTLVIGFDYPLFKDKFDNQAGAIPLVSDILTELLGQNTAVRGVVTSEYTVPVQPADFRALADELGGTVSED